MYRPVLFLPLGLIFLSLHAPASVGDGLLRTYTKSAMDFVLYGSGLPSIPSDNAKKPLSANEPDPALIAVLERLNRTFPPESRFQLKILDGDYNVYADPEKKRILMDPEFVLSLSEGSPLAVAAIFSHELGHYLYDAHILFKGLSHPILLNIPKADYEHAWVEAFACEIMVRAGYSDLEIERAFRAVHSGIERMMDELSRKFSADPSTDLESRRWVVRQWLDLSIPI
ncbi:MAG: hypothetical protein AB7G93_22130 [Bdellovibrionales bacterium]